MNKARPCADYHPELVPDKCHLCRLYVTNPEYRELWGGKKDSPALTRAEKVFPCVHLGDETGSRKQCGSCRGTVMLKEYACQKHGTITLRQCNGCPDKKPIEPTDTRHLIYHLWPNRHNDSWRWNVAQLKKREHLFNGKKIVAIATDRSTDSFTTVQRALGDGYECFALANDPGLREVSSWVELWERLSDDYSVVFCGHGKGVGHDRHDTRSWTTLMYESCLDYWPLVEERLKAFPIVGSCKTTVGLFNAPGEWYYSGTFYWVHRHGANFRNIHQHWTGTETWPGHNYSLSDGGVLFREDSHWMDYTEGRFGELILPAWEQWKIDNEKHKHA